MRSGNLLGCGMQGGRCCDLLIFTYAFAVDFGIWGARTLPPPPLPLSLLRAGARPGAPAPALGKNEGGEGGKFGPQNAGHFPSERCVKIDSCIQKLAVFFCVLETFWDVDDAAILQLLHMHVLLLSTLEFGSRLLCPPLPSPFLC